MSHIACSFLPAGVEGSRRQERPPTPTLLLSAVEACHMKFQTVSELIYNQPGTHVGASIPCLKLFRWLHPYLQVTVQAMARRLGALKLRQIGKNLVLGRNGLPLLLTATGAWSAGGQLTQRQATLLTSQAVFAVAVSEIVYVMIKRCAEQRTGAVQHSLHSMPLLPYTHSHFALLAGHRSEWRSATMVTTCPSTAGSSCGPW